MIKSLVDKKQNAFCFIKGSRNPKTATQQFTNLYFENNNINSNQSNKITCYYAFSVLIRLKYSENDNKKCNLQEREDGFIH